MHLPQITLVIFVPFCGFSIFLWLRAGDWNEICEDGFSCCRDLRVDCAAAVVSSPTWKRNKSRRHRIV